MAVSLNIQIKTNSSTIYFHGKKVWSLSESRSLTSASYVNIKNQKQHHMKKTFLEEYIKILKESGIDYDERYIFKPLYD